MNSYAISVWCEAVAYGLVTTCHFTEGEATAIITGARRSRYVDCYSMSYATGFECAVIFAYCYLSGAVRSVAMDQEFQDAEANSRRADELIYLAPSAFGCADPHAPKVQALTKSRRAFLAKVADNMATRAEWEASKRRQDITDEYSNLFGPLAMLREAVANLVKVADGVPSDKLARLLQTAEALGA